MSKIAPNVLHKQEILLAKKHRRGFSASSVIREIENPNHRRYQNCGKHLADVTLVTRMWNELSPQAALVVKPPKQKPGNIWG